MKKIAALTLAAALAGGAAFALPMARAEAAPVGVMAGVLDAGQPVVDPVGYTGRRVVRRRGRGGDAALAAGLIGAAIVGGAIIAQSQRERQYERSYTYGQPQGYGYFADPYADQYTQPVYQQPRRRYVDPGYYPQVGYGYDGGNSGYPRAHHHKNPVRDPAGGGRLHYYGY